MMENINPDPRQQWKYNLILIGSIAGLIVLGFVFGWEKAGAMLIVIIAFIVGVVAISRRRKL